MIVEIGLAVVLIALLIWQYFRRSSIVPSPTAVENNNNVTLCGAPSCIRCNSNVVAIGKAQSRFGDKWIDNQSVERLRRALEETEDAATFSECLLTVTGLKRMPVWDAMDLDQSMHLDLLVLEANWKSIRDEYETIRRQQATGDGWQLNTAADGTHQWSVFSLLNQGEWKQGNTVRCPKTTTTLHKLVSLMHGCAFGNAFFSVLPCGANIAEHCGPTNARLRCHLALEVPDVDDVRCEMEIGGEFVRWTPGKCVVFDDSFRHSVTHEATVGNSDACSDRVVLLVDFFHPDLTFDERQCLKDIF